MSLLASATLDVMTTRSAPQHIVLAGGGLAAQRCAETLRRVGYSGAIRMVCAEPHAPYDRPPLSKQLLAGTRDEPSLALRPAGWYAAHDVELLLGVGAAGLRTAEHTLVLADGAELRYDRLLIATGARARRLPALTGRGNVSVLRTVDDGRALRDALGRRRASGGDRCRLHRPGGGGDGPLARVRRDDGGGRDHSRWQPSWDRTSAHGSPSCTGPKGSRC